MRVLALAGTLMLNVPLLADSVVFPVSFTCTVTPDNGSPFSLVTVPETVLCWEKVIAGAHSISIASANIKNFISTTVCF